MAKDCIKRPHYGTVTVSRECLQDLTAARAEAGEDMLTFVSKAVAARAKKYLQRRDRRILREAKFFARDSLKPISHKVATTATAES